MLHLLPVWIYSCVNLELFWFFFSFSTVIIATLLWIRQFGENIIKLAIKTMSKFGEYINKHTGLYCLLHFFVLFLFLLFWLVNFLNDLLKLFVIEKAQLIIINYKFSPKEVDSTWRLGICWGCESISEIQIDYFIHLFLFMYIYISFLHIFFILVWFSYFYLFFFKWTLV